MKNFILFIILTLSSITCSYAQDKHVTETTILDVCKEKFLKLEVDFSQASIHNMTEEDFAIYEPSYKKDKPEVIAKLAESFNKKNERLFLVGAFPKAAYTLKVTILSVSAKGNINSMAEILGKDRNVIAKIENIYGKGGVFGCKMNLIGDGCKSTGKALAKRIEELLNSYK